MATMSGARVAVLETRMSRELARLVERYGGVPTCVPSVRETSGVTDAEIHAVVDAFTARRFDTAIFLTGVSVTTLLERAERLGRRADLVSALRGVTTVCRGPKPSAALKGAGVAVSLSAESPYTTAEVLDAMASMDLTGKSVALLHYGTRNGTLSETLRARDARVQEVCLYRWELPEDTAPLAQLVQDLADAKYDAVAFTCQVHVHHLFSMASAMDRTAALRGALQRHVAVASVGPVATAALRHYGIEPHVVPEHPKLGPLVAALARHLTKAPASIAP